MPSNSFWERAQFIDRRWLFLLIALATIIPLMFKVVFREYTTPEVEAVFYKLENLERELGRRPRVLLTFDFEPHSTPEILPMANAFTRHLALRGYAIYSLSLPPLGQQEAENVFKNILEEEFPHYEYGVDYVNLGYQPGYSGLINLLVTDFIKMYQLDARGNPTNSLPMLEGINMLGDMDLILTCSGVGMKEWVQFGADRSGVPIAGGVTAVQMPEIMPYYPQQLLGVLGGLKAAAEYETLLEMNYGYCQPDERGRGCTDQHNRLTGRERMLGIERMGPQTFAHLVIIFFIVLGNTTHFLAARARRKRQLLVEQ